MRYCPTCQSQYTDDTLRFCLQDGTPLEDGASSGSASRSGGETETLVGHRPSNQYSAPRDTQPTNWQVEPAPVEAKRSNTATAVFLTVFVMLLFFSLAGLGAWFYFQGLSDDKNSNLILANKPANRDNPTSMSTPRNAEIAKATTTPAISANTNAATTPSAIDREQIKKDVAERIGVWESQSESLDLDEYMTNYAETVDYYNKRGATRAFVRGDKQRAFAKFSDINLEISNLNVTPDASGERATAVFDKEWEFSGEESYSSGKVQTQLQLRKISGQWLITGERDLKVYYTQQ